MLNSYAKAFRLNEDSRMYVYLSSVQPSDDWDMLGRESFPPHIKTANTEKLMESHQNIKCVSMLFRDAGCKQIYLADSDTFGEGNWVSQRGSDAPSVLGYLNIDIVN